MTSPATIPSIVLSGGPCSGKSSAMALLRQKLPAYGITPLVVPEAATQIFSAGLSVQDMLRSPDTWRSFQLEMLRAQLAQEEHWRQFAALMPGERRVLLCDRGALDGMAYIDPAVFEGILYDLDLSVAHVRDRRYLAVFHLVTAARGAEAHYTLANNAARTETPEEARALDDRTLAAWTGHQRLHIVSNTRAAADGTPHPVSFNEKMHTVLTGVCRTLGVPVPGPVEHKFLLADAPNLPASLHAVATDIEQTYLVSGDHEIERRVRHLRPAGAGAALGDLYVYAEKRATPTGRITTERVLSAREYQQYLAERDGTRAIVRKRRTAFGWHDQYFQLDTFAGPTPMHLLEVTLPEGSARPQLPPFLAVARDVTTDPAYRNAAIAARTAA